MKPNTEPPMTLSRIAEWADTSASTVSRVLSNDPRISEATRERVLNVLKEHPYQPNTFARALKGGRTGMIGVLSSSISSGFYAEVLRGIDEVSRNASIHVMCSFAHGAEDYRNMALEMMTGRRVDGVILIAPPSELFDLPLPPRSVPVVLCAGRQVQMESVWHAIDSVTVDCRAAMALLVDQLASQGCRKWIHLAGPGNSYDAQSRRSAFQEAVAEHEDWETSVLSGHLIEEDGLQTTEELIRGKAPLPDAWVCFNDSTALGVIRALKAAGIEQNGRIGLTGWDDDATGSFLGLTSVAIPMVDLGRQSAGRLFEHLNPTKDPVSHPCHLSLPASVQFRTSTILTPIPPKRSPNYDA